MTAWATEGYDTAKLGGIKDGVGLRVGLATPATVTAVRLSSTTPGGALQVLGESLDASTPRPVIGEGVLPSGTAEIRVTSPEPVSEIIIWLTELPDSGTGPRRFRASIGEVEVLGVAKT